MARYSFTSRTPHPRAWAVCSGVSPWRRQCAHPVVSTEITVDRLQAVEGLAGHDVRLLPFGVGLPANNPLRSESRSHVVQGGAARDDRVGGPLLLGQQHRDPTVLGVEQFGEVAVGEQSPLLMGLLAQAEGLVQHPLGRGERPPTCRCTSSAVERSRRTGTRSVSTSAVAAVEGPLMLTAIPRTCPCWTWSGGDACV